MFREAARDLPSGGSYDVVVIGGGVAGVSAAIAAARTGASVCLLEKTVTLGGLATLGNVLVFLPLCDGRGTQLVGGLGEELLRHVTEDVRTENKDLALCLPPTWPPETNCRKESHPRYRCSFNVGSCLLALEAMVAEADVQLLYDTRFCAVIKDGDVLRAVVIENKDGRSAVAGTVFVDATGDADVCVQAGENTVSVDSNVLCGWHYVYRNGGLSIRKMSNRYSPRADRADAVGPFFAGDKADDVTQHVIQSRNMIRESVRALREAHPDDEIYPMQLAACPTFRMTRRLKREDELGPEHDHQHCPDTIGMIGDWRTRGPAYAIPYRSILAEKTPNLLVAGRCMSVDNDLWDVTRAIPACAVTGEAAGTAASMAAARDRRVGDLPVRDLQRALAEKGAILGHMMEV